MRGKIGFSSIFFILAFTFSIFCFIVSSTLIEAKTIYNKRYDKETNKIVDFNTETRVLVDEFLKVIDGNDLTITLAKPVYEAVDKENVGYSIVTKLKTNKYDSHNNIISGEYLSNEGYKGDEKIGVTTSEKQDIRLTYIRGKDKKEINLKKVGAIAGDIKTIVVPNKVFFEYVGDNTLNSNIFSLTISGEEEEIKEACLKIKEFSKTLKPINDKDTIMLYSPTSTSSTIETSFLAYMMGLIIFITVLNSISISSLWVEDKRKELILRKVCGGKRMDLFKLFVKDISIISAISFVLAFLLYFIFIKLTNNALFGLHISLSISNCIKTIVISIFTIYIITIPSMKKIMNLQIIEVLREE
ncbi:MAG: FtsX-like permease family protein [Clostridium sp.]